MNLTDNKPAIALGSSVADRIAVADAVVTAVTAHPIYGTGGTGVISALSSEIVSLGAGRSQLITRQNDFTEKFEDAKWRTSQAQLALDICISQARKLRDLALAQLGNGKQYRVGFRVQRTKTAGTDATHLVVIPSSAPAMIVLGTRVQEVVTAATYDGSLLGDQMAVFAEAADELAANYRTAVVARQDSSYLRALRDETYTDMTARLRKIRDWGFALFPTNYDELSQFGFVVTTSSGGTDPVPEDPGTVEEQAPEPPA